MMGVMVTFQSCCWARAWRNELFFHRMCCDSSYPAMALVLVVVAALLFAFWFGGVGATPATVERRLLHHHPTFFTLPTTATHSGVPQNL